MIKLFEQFNNEQEIINICKKYNIKNYTINPDGSIDVESDLYLSNFNLDKLPLKFNKVNGDFYCSSNKLTNLEGSPNEVSGSFSCSFNFITSLVGCPNEVNDSFNCSYNELTSFIGSPMGVGKNFYCNNNQITSLEGGPMIIGGNFLLKDNPISIIDSSIEVKGDIIIDYTNFDNMIKSLSQDKLRILFEHGIDYNIFDKDGVFHVNRLEGMFKDFNI